MYVVPVWLKWQFLILKPIGYEELFRVGLKWQFLILKPIDYEELFRFYHCSGSLTGCAEPS
jgi:hypothetical protein